MNTRTYLVSAVLLLISFQACKKEQPYDPPEWSEGVVWYQIFPERFNDGNPDNQPTAMRARGPENWELSSWTSDWYERAEWETDVSDDFYATVRNRRYGGDLEGVIKKLDYLKELGIGAIYFNPIFDAQSMHKYDASYYHHIDRNFGPDPVGDLATFEREDPSDPSTWNWTAGDSLFLELIEEAHARNIRVVIDGVWNHTGTEFWAFQDLVDNQEQSKFKDWYVVTSFDDPQTPENEFDYEGWWGFKGLPVFREVDGNLNEGAKAHIFAVTRKWMDPNGDGDPSDGVDGWRLDVAEEVGTPFWKEWHELVHQINPEAITVAEIWTDEAKHYLSADLFTSVMNYRFTDAVKLFLIDQAITLEEFLERLQQIETDYPNGSVHVLQNLLDSHDTARLASSIVNVGYPYNPDDKPVDGYEVRKPNSKEVDIQKMVAAFQFTWPGSPMIYYGTEAGMWGADDPDDRKPMLWPEYVYEVEDNHPFGDERPADENIFNDDLYTFYKTLTRIRSEFPVLRNGKTEILAKDQETGFFVFSRSESDQETVFTAVNPSRTPAMFVKEGCKFQRLSGGYVIDGVRVEINPMSAAIFSGICEPSAK